MIFLLDDSFIFSLSSRFVFNSTCVCVVPVVIVFASSKNKKVRQALGFTGFMLTPLPSVNAKLPRVLGSTFPPKGLGKSPSLSEIITATGKKTSSAKVRFKSAMEGYFQCLVTAIARDKHSGKAAEVLSEFFSNAKLREGCCSAIYF